MPILPHTENIFYRMWDTAAPKADVVFLHGAGEYSGLYHRFAAHLNMDGYRVWAIDHIAHGNTPGSVEDVYDILNLAENAKKLLQFVQERKNPLKTVLIGNSLGGVTSGVIMSLPDAPSVAGLVLTSTPLAPLQNIDKLDQAVMSLEPTYLAELDSDPVLKQMEPLDYYRLDKTMCAGAERIDQSIGTWKFPVLFINGEKDTLALPENAGHWAAKASRGRAVIIKNGHHDIINDTAYLHVARLICDFVFESTCDDFL